MPPTTYASGTQAASVGTEHFLSQPNVPGIFELRIDTFNMTLGDTIELRMYAKTIAGATSRVAYYQAYWDQQPTDDRMKISAPLGNAIAETGAIRISLKQTSGTSRSFDWFVMGYDL